MYSIVSRLYFGFLACAWGGLIFGMHQEFGYEKAYGYPPIAESIAWACALASPFLIGLFLLHSVTVLSRVARLLATATLVGELYFMLFVGWMWDIRMIIRHILDGTFFNILDGTFFNAFFVVFVLGPPVLMVIAIGFLLAPEIRRHK